MKIKKSTIGIIVVVAILLLVQIYPYIQPGQKNSNGALPVGNRDIFVAQTASSGSLPEVSYIFSFEHSSGVTYVPSNGNLYVSDGNLGEITVVNASTNSIAGYIGDSPYFGNSVYDSFNGYLYVVAGNGEVFVINPLNESLVARIGGFTIGYGYLLDPPATTLVLDSINHNIYLKTVERTVGTLYEINTTTNVIQQELGGLGVGGAITFVPQFNTIYYVETNQTILKLNPANLSIRGYITYPWATGDIIIPNAIGFDQRNDYLYVESTFTEFSKTSVNSWNNLSIVAAKSDAYLSSYKLGNDGGNAFSNTIVYDNITGTLFIASAQRMWETRGTSAGVSQLSGSFYDPYELTVDTTNGTVYGSSYASLFWYNTSSVNMSSTSNPMAAPYGIAYNPVNSQMYVVNQNNNQIIIINATTDHISGSINGSGNGFGISIDAHNGDLMEQSWAGTPDGSVEYFTSIMDPDNGSILHKFNASNVVSNPTTGEFYVQDGSSILTVSGSDWGTLNSFNVTNGISAFIYDTQLNALAIINNNNTFILLNASNGKLVSSVPVPTAKGYPRNSNIALGYNGTVAFFYHSNQLCALNIVTGEYLWNVSESSNNGPFFTFITYNPTSQLLYLTNTFGQSCYVVNSNTGQLLDSIILINTANGIAFDPINSAVLVACGNVGLGDSVVAVLNYSISHTSSYLETPVGTLIILAGLGVGYGVFLAMVRKRR